MARPKGSYNRKGAFIPNKRMLDTLEVEALLGLRATIDTLIAKKRSMMITLSQVEKVYQGIIALLVGIRLASGKLLTETYLRSLSPMELQALEFGGDYDHFEVLVYRVLDGLRDKHGKLKPIRPGLLDGIRKKGQNAPPASSVEPLVE